MGGTQPLTSRFEGRPCWVYDRRAMFEDCNPSLIVSLSVGLDVEFNGSVRWKRVVYLSFCFEGNFPAIAEARSALDGV